MMPHSNKQRAALSTHPDCLDQRRRPDREIARFMGCWQGDWMRRRRTGRRDGDMLAAGRD